eukprot:jgi/Astpho2/3332/fgenesh1_pg.00054_%23_27_t
MAMLLSAADTAAAEADAQAFALEQALEMVENQLPQWAHQQNLDWGATAAYEPMLLRGSRVMHNIRNGTDIARFLADASKEHMQEHLDNLRPAGETSSAASSVPDKDTEPDPRMSAWLAAKEGNRDMLRAELEGGADIEHRDPMGRTALMEAAKYKHVDCVRELLDRGADPTTRSFMGSSAQDYGSDHSEIHRLLDQATQQWLADRGLSQQQQPAHIAGNGLGPATVRGGGGGQATSDAGSSRTEASHPFSQSPHGAPQTGSTPSPKASQLSTSPHNSNYSSQGPTQAQQVPLPAMSGSFTASGSYPGQTGMAGSMGRSSSTSHQQPGSLGAGGEQPPHQGGQLHANAPSFGMSEMGLHQAPYGARQGGQEFPQPGGYGGQPQYEHGGQRGQLGGMSGNQHQQGRGGGGLRPMQPQPQMAMYSQMPAGAPGGPGPGVMGGPPSGLPPHGMPGSGPSVSAGGTNMGRPVCRYWHSGRCLYGDHCRFAHPATPAPAAPPATQPVCRYWRFGTCRYGPACRFRHPIESDPNAPRGSGIMRPANMQQLPRSALAEQLQQQRQRNFGFTDAEMMDLLTRGVKPWEAGMPGGGNSGQNSMLSALQNLHLGSSSTN